MLRWAVVCRAAAILGLLGVGRAPLLRAQFDDEDAPPRLFAYGAAALPAGTLESRATVGPMAGIGAMITIPRSVISLRADLLYAKPGGRTGPRTGDPTSSVQLSTRIFGAQVGGLASVALGEGRVHPFLAFAAGVYNVRGNDQCSGPCPFFPPQPVSRTKFGLSAGAGAMFRVARGLEGFTEVRWHDMLDTRLDDSRDIAALKMVSLNAGLALPL